jgi:hypothetical protein
VIVRLLRILRVLWKQWVDPPPSLEEISRQRAVRLEELDRHNRFELDEFDRELRPRMDLHVRQEQVHAEIPVTVIASPLICRDVEDYIRQNPRRVIGIKDLPFSGLDYALFEHTLFDLSKKEPRFKVGKVGMERVVLFVP